MESSMFFGNTCQNGLMPALVRPSLPAVPTSLGMKQFLPIPLDTSPVGLFPGLGAMDPVQKAVLHHTHSLPPTTVRRHVSCSVCQLRFNSQSQALAHYKGTKHAKKLKSLETPKSKLKGSAVTKETASQEMAKGINASQVSNGSDRKGCSTPNRGQQMETENDDLKSEPPPSKRKRQIESDFDEPGTDASTSKKSQQARVHKDVTKSETSIRRSWSKIEIRAVEKTLTHFIESDGVSAAALSPATRPSPPAASPVAVSSTTVTENSSSARLGDERPLKLESPSEPEPDQEAEPETETNAETEDEKARRLLYCSLCKVAVNSASQLEAHNSGTKHKTMLEARSGMGCIKSFPRAGVKGKLATTSKSSTGLQNKTFYCETCDVHVNSETQLKQHISSRRHKDRAAGKPAKPKYSPYSKPQKGQSKQPIKLILGKERACRPLSAQVIPAHLAAVAAAAAAALGSSLTHRTSHAPNHAPTPSLFQTQTLPSALFRQAAGPVRTSHPQVLFAPY